MVLTYVKLAQVLSPVALRLTLRLPTPVPPAENSISPPPVLVHRDSHLVDALHPALFQVRLGTQEVGVLGVVRRLLEIDVDAVCGAGRRYWMEKDRKQMLLLHRQCPIKKTKKKTTPSVRMCFRMIRQR